MKVVLLLATVVGIGSFETPARAYNGFTHQKIVDTAWEVMLATQDPALTTGRDLFSSLDVAPKSLRSADTPMTQAEWDAFIAEIKASILTLNRMPSGLSGNTNADCSGIGPLVTLGKIARRINTGYSGTDNLFRGDDNSGNSCQLAGARSGIYSRLGQGSTLQFGPGGAPPGFIPGLAGEFGLTEAQGLVLGWHSKAGDDCVEDVVLGMNIGQIIINLPIPALGGLSLNQVASIGIAIVALPFICFFDLLSGDDCSDSIEKARNFANDVNPLTALAGLVPPLDLDISGGLYSGLPHFINSLNSGPPRNRYDDRRGMLYDHAGPGGSLSPPGAVDIGIMLLTEKLGLVVDADVGSDDTHALMVDRYDLGQGSAGDGHPEVSDTRDDWTWNRQTLGHIPMTPIDNFAFFGWKSFRDDGQRNVKNLRWPLHALGDASVPMHITTTTGYGHRPYEDAFQDSIPRMRSDSVMVAPVMLAQLEQARRILKEAFRVRQFIKDQRAALGRTNDTPVRDLVTKLALDTLGTVSFLGGDWYCDSCSTAYLLGGLSEEGAVAHYMDDDHVGRMTVLFEKSVAYTLAFLMSATEQPITQKVCSETGEPCQNDLGCCVGACDTNAGTCLPPPRPTGPFSCDENGQCPRGQCINGYCEGGNECNKPEQCPSGQCLNGFCGDPCASGADCPGGGCQNGRCCNVDHRECTAVSDCCSGICWNGQCRPGNGQPGDPCSLDSDCIRGTCQNGTCSDDCTSDNQCTEVQACQNATCCIPINGQCFQQSDCCGTFVRCGHIGSLGITQCLTPLMPGAGFCSNSEQCLRGRCIDGVCQTGCSSPTDCAQGTCVNGQCCSQAGSICASAADCCGSQACTNNRCVSDLPPPPQ